MKRFLLLVCWTCLAGSVAAQDAARELTERGADAAHDMLAALVTGRVTRPEDGATHALDAAEREALLAALIGLERAGLRAAVAFVEAEPDDRARAVALQVAAGLPQWTDVATLTVLASSDPGAEQPERLEAAVRDRLEDALAGLLAYAPAAHRDLAHALERPACRAAALRAVGRTADPRGIDLLVAAVAAGDAWSLGALSQIVAVAPFVRDADPWLVRTLIGLLTARDRAACQLAAQALGELGVVDAVPYLVDLLGQDDAAVRASARRALQRISGLALPADSASWELWLRGEERWVVETLPGLLEDLRSDAPGRRRAISELAGRRLHRAAIEGPLLELLDVAEAPLRAEICGALGRLGSRAAFPRMLALLDDPDAEVAAAARGALANSSHGRPPADWAALAARHTRWEGLE